jgi:dTDP-4-dehydrorhamnose 3,5-epimerase
VSVLSRFTVGNLPLAGLKLVERQAVGDHRGSLARLFCAEELVAAGWVKPIAQINHAYTARRGTVRGMHFQYPPHAEMKLVTCLCGEIFDVAVDLRRESSTFLKWHGEVLSAANRRSLLIPKGCAHGFQTLSDDCELIYLHSAPYDPAAEGALNPADPQVGIAWPLPIAELSDRDRSHPMLGSDYKGIAP